MSEFLPPIAELGAPDEPVGPKDHAPLWLLLLLIWSCVSSLVGTALTTHDPEIEPFKWWITIPIAGLWACLCVACYNGVDWARWIIVVLSVLVVPLSFMPDDVKQDLPAQVWKIVDVITALAIAGVLLSPSMKRYFVGVSKPNPSEPR